MQNLLNPRWFLLINTFPVLILFVIFSNGYGIIKSLLPIESLELWRLFGGILLALFLIHLAYTVMLIVRRRLIPSYYGLIALVVYITFLYNYGIHSDSILPWDIPRWMLPRDMILYVGTFLMPTLAHALLILVVRLTKEGKEYHAGLNFLKAIMVPILWFSFSQIVLPFWQLTVRGFDIHVIIIFIIIGTLIFLFYLARAVYILAGKKRGFWIRYQLVWKIPIALLFPLLGLAINNGHWDTLSAGIGTGIFGDFKSIWFYVLATVNGVVICLPNSHDILYRWILLVVRSFTFSFTIYFFLVFLPYLPLSVVAIVAIGLGFLMLTPIVLFVIHLTQISHDFQFLIDRLPKATVISSIIGGVVLIPFIITLANLNDRSVLNESLEYLYTPDYSKEYQINRKSLANTLQVIKMHKEKSNSLGGQTPYLSTYYNWLVLDNLTLAESKIQHIEQVFFDKPKQVINTENIRNDSVAISKVDVTSSFDKSQGAWVSWISLEITNNSDDPWFNEYATTIDLPAGCWINDYYLYVGDRKEMGILAEKKAAMWVFSQIRNTQKDPGILYYLTGNRVAFRVFPFNGGEVRRTGIQFIHKERVTMEIDGHKITMGDDRNPMHLKLAKLDTKEVTYVSSAEKLSLPLVQRKAYYHFIVDISDGNNSSVDNYSHRITSFLNAQNVALDESFISFTNSRCITQRLDKDWKQSLSNQSFAGGFYLERAIKEILVKAHVPLKNSYPVMVVVTDTMRNAIIERDFADLKMTFPESNRFYELTSTGQLKPHSLIGNPKVPLANEAPVEVTPTVLAWPNKHETLAYLRNDALSEVVLTASSLQVQDSEIVLGSWQSGLLLQGMWLSQVLNPKLAQDQWVDLVRSSFISKVMTPLTSYIVVENEAQKAILKQKQDQVISGNKSLDLGEDAQRMTEPGLIIVLILLGLFFIMKRIRSHGWKLKFDILEQ